MIRVGRLGAHVLRDTYLHGEIRSIVSFIDGILNPVMEEEALQTEVLTHNNETAE